MVALKMHFLLVAVLLIIQFSSVLSKIYRLPNDVKPVRYNLTVEPNLLEENFNGSIIMDLMSLESTKNITFHIRNITIDEASVKVVENEGSEIIILGTSSDDSSETYTVHLESDLEKNKSYSLIIGNFSGSLLGNKIGFYLTFYADEDGNERRLAVTDFEPSDARQAFPCFDEPALKARFQVNIIRNKNYSSLSNEELTTTTYLGNDRYLDTYKETPEMSTYLVAFVVSDFVSTKVMERHRIFARPQAISQGEFSYSMEVSVEVLRVLENFTGINYAMKKIDQLALPDSQFIPLGMENWGLIIYRESSLACSNSSSLKRMQSCIMCISHELAHQWFGNLVTAAWWDYVWLNEGFAAYFQYYIASIIQPSWRFLDQYVVDKFHFALEYDVPVYTNRSLNYQAEPPDEPLHYIIYAKGGAIVRMMEHFLTHDVFRKGLNIYLENKKFSSAIPQDLYNGLQDAVDDAGVNHLLGSHSVSEIMKTWTDNPGYPVVNVIRNYENGDITFEQKDFKEDVDKVQNETIWYIPINYAFESDNEQKLLKTTADFWLSQKNITINSNLITTDGWILVNLQETGYYRVNYDLENWNRLINALKTNYEAIPVLNRATLVKDAIYLAKAKQLPYNVTFSLIDYLRKEKDYMPISAFINSKLDLFNYFEVVYNESKFEELPFYWNRSFPKGAPSSYSASIVLGEYTKHILEGNYDYIGIDEKPNDTHLDKLKRIAVVEALYKSRHLGTTRDILRKFEQLKKDNSTYISPDLQDTVFCKGSETKGGKGFLKQLYLESRDTALRLRIKHGLLCNQFRLKAYGRLTFKFIVIKHIPVLKDLKFDWLSLF